GEEDGRTPAAGERALEGVAVGEGSSQLLKWIRQRRLRGSGDSHRRVPSAREPAAARPPEPTVPRSNRGWRIGCLSAVRVRDVARLSRVFTIVALQPTALEQEQPDACRPCRRRSALRFIGVGLWKFYEPCELVWQQRGQCERQHVQFESVLTQQRDVYTRTVGLL